MSTEKTLLEQIKDVVKAAHQYSDLSKEIKSTVFVDKKTNNEYDSLEEAYDKGVTDIGSFEKITKTFNPKQGISKMISGQEKLTSEDVEQIKEFARLAGKIDAEADYKKKYNSLMNKKSKAKKEGDKNLVAELEKQITELNDRFGKRARKKRK
ncbi:MAG: hypothetical protein ACOCPW_04595 [Marinilabiliaceae bacterium]